MEKLKNNECTPADLCYSLQVMYLGQFLFFLLLVSLILWINIVSAESLILLQHFTVDSTCIRANQILKSAGNCVCNARGDNRTGNGTL